MSHRSQIVYPFVAKIKITDENNIIFIVLGQSRTPVPTNKIETFAFGYRPNKDLYLALHNLKSKKHAVACCPRVSTSHFNKSAVRYVATFTNIPNYRRNYRRESRMHPIPTPQEVLLVLFFQEKNRKTPLQLTTQTNYYEHYRKNTNNT